MEQPLLVYVENGLGREKLEIQGDQLEAYVVIQLRDNSALGQSEDCEKENKAETDYILKLN